MPTATVHRCTDCLATAPQWAGRCPACGAWNSLEEIDRAAAAAPGRGGGARAPAATPIGDVGADEHPFLATGVGELDRVLGGGLTADSVTLVGGAPGVGKSTLLLQLSAGLAVQGCRVLYASAEETTAQVRARAARLGAVVGGLWLASATTLDDVMAQLDDVRPDVLVLDSVQTVHVADATGVPGSPGQVRECAQRLVRVAKERGIATLLVGHVTKDGGLAGPRVLEHLVDTVLSFEGDRHHALRLLRATKHRFGPTAQLGLFEMTGEGLVGVADPSRLFLADRRPGVAGSAVVPVVEGARPLLIEVQALLIDSGLPTPRRVTQGLDASRLTLMLAVLDRRCGLALSGRDAYATAAGGVRVSEPGADLGLALALASGGADQPLPADMVACGEVGLGGEVRQVAELSRRLHEAGRLGFRHAVVPRSAPDPPPGLELVRVRTLTEALTVCGLTGPSPPPAEPPAQGGPACPAGAASGVDDPRSLQ